jgi:hypothetical protein
MCLKAERVKTGWDDRLPSLSSDGAKTLMQRANAGCWSPLDRPAGRGSMGAANERSLFARVSHVLQVACLPRRPLTVVPELLAMMEGPAWERSPFHPIPRVIIQYPAAFLFRLTHTAFLLGLRPGFSSQLARSVTPRQAYRCQSIASAGPRCDQPPPPARCFFTIRRSLCFS